MIERYNEDHQDDIYGLYYALRKELSLADFRNEFSLSSKDLKFEPGQEVNQLTEEAIVWTLAVTDLRRTICY